MLRRKVEAMQYTQIQRINKTTMMFTWLYPVMLMLSACPSQRPKPESPPSPAAASSGALRTNVLTTTGVMVYEGACAWLACASVYGGNPSCGGTCSDSDPWVARPNTNITSCGNVIRICSQANGRCVNAKVRDTHWPQDNTTWEGNRAVFDALQASYADGICDCEPRTGLNNCPGATYGYGQVNVTITDCGAPYNDYKCTSGRVSIRTCYSNGEATCSCTPWRITGSLCD